jgi:membrane protease YdiL (CAAX protease family)
MPEASVSLPGLFGSDAVGLLLAIVMVVVVGPLVEEAVFRGALLEGLAARFGVWPAIFVQAALFAAFHRSLWLLFPTFVLGVALGWLAHERESLWPPIAMHALYNAITVAAAFLVA